MRATGFWLLLTLGCGSLVGAAEPVGMQVWPGTPPGETRVLPQEADQTKPTDNLIAGRRIIKLGNVSVPQIAVYAPPPEKNTGAAVVICPGGGHHILAYDLEGTEVAEWLNDIGVCGIVLKYRVPFRDPENRSLAATQDAQRAMSLVRKNAATWKIDSKRIGILGFSAGGEVAGVVSLTERRLYDAVDDVDKTPHRPDFSVLIYPAYLVDKSGQKLRDGLTVNSQSPPMFFVHAYDDGVTPLNSLLVAVELKRAGVPAEVHMFASGGHGYGLRHVDGEPVTDWPKLCEAWLANRGLTRAAGAAKP